MELLRPTTGHLAGYADALRRGWSPDNLRPAAALSLLQNEGHLADAECRERAAAAQLPPALFETVWDRLSHTV